MNLPSPDKKYKSKNHKTYSCQYHVIFCPKYRRKVLTDGIDERLKVLIKETADMYDFEVIDMEVMPDHVHLLIDCAPEPGIAECVKKLKARTSHILRLEYPKLKTRIPTLWTRSCFISSVGAVSLETVKRYIDEQKHV